MGSSFQERDYDRHHNGLRGDMQASYKQSWPFSVHLMLLHISARIRVHNIYQTYIEYEKYFSGVINDM